MKHIFIFISLIVFFSKSVFSQYISIYIKPLTENEQIIQSFRIQINDSIPYIANYKTYINVKNNDIITIDNDNMSAKTIHISPNTINHDTISIILYHKTNLLKEVFINPSININHKITNINKIEQLDIKRIDISKSFTSLVENFPSIVTTSDAGNDIGYTYMRLRGMDQSRINVTINGIPISDMESQQVFWVDLPDISSSSSSIQIQKGVGTSTNGVSAFGGSINIQTDKLVDSAFVETSNSYGSFNSIKNNILASTGVLNKHFFATLRLSNIKSDGYIDRAFSNLKSYYIGLSYFDDYNKISFINMLSHERTYLAWLGIPKDSLLTNPRYNPYNYENEIDDYTHNQYQLILQRKKGIFSSNISLFYTNGFGYYEQYKDNQLLTDYNLQSNINDYSDLIRRKHLDNDLLGVIMYLNMNNMNNDFSIGTSISKYYGRHFGKVIWTKNMNDFPENHTYYNNNSNKNDFNIYTQYLYKSNKNLQYFIDFQYRHINYYYEGLQYENQKKYEKVAYNFINPKIGIKYIFNSNHNLYALLAVSNKEPNRDDLVNSLDNSIKHESVYDFEITHNYNLGKFYFITNFYFMKFANHLVNNGKVNDIGEYIRSNVLNSNRAGIEFELNYKSQKSVDFFFNTTISQNKIIKHSEYIDNWDSGEQIIANYNNNDLSFSPNLIANFTILFNTKSIYKSKNIIELLITDKYVSKQYIDNSNSKDRMLNDYNKVNVIINLYIKSKLFEELIFKFGIYNITNNYSPTSAWVYRYFYQDKYQQDEAYFPQAGINFLAGINIKL